MNLDDVMAAWRSQERTPLCGVDRTLLHEVLRQEHSRLERLRRRVGWSMFAVNSILFVTAALFLAIMIDPGDDDVLIVWDYVVGVIGVGAALVLAWALRGTYRAQQAREQSFGDSLRDHLRRRIAQIDDVATGDRRPVLIILASLLICGAAISIAGHRINDVPWGEFTWPSPVPAVLILGLTYLLLFRWRPRERQRYVLRKQQLEAVLRELDR